MSNNSKKINLERGPLVLDRPLTPKKNFTDSKQLEHFLNENKKGTVRVFVAGGSRSGKQPVYIQEAFLLGQVIAKMGYRLDFGLASKGIMGAVAEGVLSIWSKEKNEGKPPIQGVTLKEYLELYENGPLLSAISDIIVAHTLEERKQQLLKADFVIFTPGGVGTLDELVYNCVAMQDGFLPFKPFILFNVEGFFHHILEYLKEINQKGFSDNMPFIVVDNAEEAEVAFTMLPFYYNKDATRKISLKSVQNVIHDLPYIIHQHFKCPEKPLKKIILDTLNTLQQESDEQKELLEQIETAYLKKETERMYERLAKTGKDTAVISDKLTTLRNKTKRRK